jgi:hypothetical protein
MGQMFVAGASVPVHRRNLQRQSGRSLKKAAICHDSSASSQ